MKNWSLALFLVATVALVTATLLASCTRPQPPGKGIYLGVH